MDFEAYAAFTADFYYASEVPLPSPEMLDPRVTLMGPVLLRRPRLLHYLQLYRPAMAQELLAAMAGREELYATFRDLLTLLYLQFDPDLATWVTAHEYRRAVERLTAFLVPDVASPEARFLQAHVPLVISTQYHTHSYPVPHKRTRREQPSTWPADAFVLWFRQRLLRAVIIRHERFPNNPLWVAPDGSFRGLAHPTEQEIDDLNRLRKAICGPTHTGRPKGTGRFKSDQDFQTTMLHHIQSLLHAGRRPTQENIAECENVTDRQIRAWETRHGITCAEIARRRAKLSS